MPWLNTREFYVLQDVPKCFRGRGMTNYSTTRSSTVASAHWKLAVSRLSSSHAASCYAVLSPSTICSAITRRRDVK